MIIAFTATKCSISARHTGTEAAAAAAPPARTADEPCLWKRFYGSLNRPLNSSCVAVLVLVVSRKPDNACLLLNMPPTTSYLT